jgi:hypothetical protein
MHSVSPVTSGGWPASTPFLYNKKKPSRSRADKLESAKGTLQGGVALCNAFILQLLTSGCLSAVMLSVTFL